MYTYFNQLCTNWYCKTNVLSIGWSRNKIQYKYKYQCFIWTMSQQSQKVSISTSVVQEDLIRLLYRFDAKKPWQSFKEGAPHRSSVEKGKQATSIKLQKKLTWQRKTDFKDVKMQHYTSSKEHALSENLQRTELCLFEAYESWSHAEC